EAQRTQRHRGHKGSTKNTKKAQRTQRKHKGHKDTEDTKKAQRTRMHGGKDVESAGNADRNIFIMFAHSGKFVAIACAFLFTLKP
ncbi:MAG: hypothetical protein RMM17_14260, partial [Acidobacteriota bacterium]|nr:hypothetical protein [Acidobacteriota bacterium]